MITVSSEAQNWDLPEQKRLPRSKFIRNAKQTEFFGGGQWREVTSPDGVTCCVTRLWGNAA
jgi:hypothetical protein